MWSDECSAGRGRGRAIEWCFGVPADKWNPECVVTKKTGKDIRVMVWACFWGGPMARRSELFVMNCDSESKRHGYSARPYIEVLEDQLPKCWVPGYTFMQDNALIHTSKAVA
jgi:hypothetical protein